MSDLFVSELIILFFLLVPLLRPFSKILKNAPAVLLFPFFAIVLSICTILGQGIYFSITLLLFFSIVVFFFLLGKTVSFIVKLPTHFYSIIEIGAHIFFLVCSLGLVFVTFAFIPERVIPLNGKPISQFIELPDMEGKTFGKLTVLSSSYNENKNVCIIFLPMSKRTFHETNTIVNSFLNNGYKVITLDTLTGNTFFSLKNIDSFIKAIKLFFSDSHLPFEQSVLDSQVDIDIEYFTHLLNSIMAEFAKDNSVYIFSEGMYNQTLFQYVMSEDNVSNENKCRGAFVISSNDFVEPSHAHTFSIDFDNEVSFLPSSKLSSLCLLKQSKKYLPYFSEMRADDVLATWLLDSEIDVGRQDRMKIASIFEKWISIRESFYSSVETISNEAVLYGGK